MHEAGWGIEVVSWEDSCKRELREWATKNGRFIRLDDYYDSITFLQGGRRSAPINLTRRDTAAPRPGLRELAETKARAESAEEMESMKLKIEELTRRRASKDRKKKKYDKRMARQRGASAT